MSKHAVNALMAAAILIAPLSAQMARSVTSFGSRSGQRNGFPRAVFWGAPFWADDFSSPYSQPPSVIVVQPPAATSPSSSRPIEESKPITPLLIEWQGDRYVRRTEVSGSSPRANQPDYVAEAKPRLTPGHGNAANAQPVAAPQAPELAPATFVFRDGHREQSSDYSIISGVIYARGDYWTNGYWSKQIPVAQLDVPATIKANQEHGVNFRLPSAPNEVITRP